MKRVAVVHKTDSDIWTDLGEVTGDENEHLPKDEIADLIRNADVEFMEGDQIFFDEV